MAHRGRGAAGEATREAEAGSGGTRRFEEEETSAEVLASRTGDGPEAATAGIDAGISSPGRLAPGSRDDDAVPGSVRGGETESGAEAGTTGTSSKPGSV